MHSFLPFLVIGLASGSLYGLSSLGLVLTYRISGVFNFAFGAIGMFSAFSFYWLRQHEGWPTLLCLVVVVLAAAPLSGAFFDRLLLRPTQDRGSTAQIVVSIGLLVALEGLAIVAWAAHPQSANPILPTATYKLFGVAVGWDQTIVVLVGLGALLLLTFFIRKAPLGLRMRAVVDNPDLAGYFGIDAARTRTISWMLGFFFASLAGVLLAPMVGLDITVLSLLVVQAFGAAALGRFVSLWAAYVGALVIGIAGALLTKYLTSEPSLQGLPESLPFIVLFLVLVLSRRHSFQELSTARNQRLALPTRSLRLPQLAVFVGGAFAVVGIGWNISAGHRLTLTSAVIMLLLFNSLRLLVGLARQMSLAHVVFMALGATTLMRLTSHGVPYLVALPLAGLVLIPVGALLAIPAVRLRGVYLALATLGFGVLVQYLVYPTFLGFGGGQAIEVPRASLFGYRLTSDRSYLIFVVAVVLLGVLVTEQVFRSRLGRILRASADSPMAMESLGISPTAARVVTFSLSGALAAVAGGLYGSLVQSAAPQTYDFFQSLLYVAVLVTAGAMSLRGTLFAAVGLEIIPGFVHSGTVTNWLTVAFGVGAIVMARYVDGIPMRVPMLHLLGYRRPPSMGDSLEHSVGSTSPVRMTEDIAK